VEERCFPSVFSQSSGALEPFKCVAVLHWLSKTEPMLLTVSRMEGWSFPNVFSWPSRARWNHSSALPYSPWVVECYANVIDGAESGRVVLSGCLLTATESSLVSLNALPYFPSLAKTILILWTVLRVEGWSFLSVFSLLSMAHWYYTSALPYSPWLAKSMLMLWTVLRVKGWSFPSVFSLPSRARWNHSSALSYPPGCRNPSPVVEGGRVVLTECLLAVVSLSSRACWWHSIAVA
jgi:hypothetical protein